MQIHALAQVHSIFVRLGGTIGGTLVSHIVSRTMNTRSKYILIVLVSLFLGWLIYWVGYSYGLRSGRHFEHLVLYGSTLDDIHFLKHLNRRELDRLEKSLSLSIETKLEQLALLAERMNRSPVIEMLSEASYETPKSAYTLSEYRRIGEKEYTVERLRALYEKENSEGK